MHDLNIKKIAIGAGAFLGLMFFWHVSHNLLETNQEGYYQVKQAAVSGKMSVRSSAGTYFQMFGDIFTYHISDMYYFSKHDLDGGSGKETASIKVRFNDGGTADISGALKYRLSTKEEDQIALHRDFKGYHAVKMDLIRQVVAEALMQTATLMRAEESYSTRRSEFTSLAEEQIKKGIYETVAREIKETDVDGNQYVEHEVNVKRDAAGVGIVRKPSPLVRYNIEVLQFIVKDIDFDETIDKLITKKKEAEQQKVVARANAEKARQDAITEREQGAARIAKAKADEDVEKIKGVTQAQKAFEVAQFQRKQAEEEAKAKTTQGQAEAAVAKLKVAAGLSPAEAAEYKMKTAIGVAEKMAAIQFPSTMVIGGSGQNGHALNPFDAVGLKSFIELSDSIAAGNNTRPSRGSKNQKNTNDE
jgi:regulator of protease activity HflC (stomatin/prohibitin superfamily)